MNRFYKKLWPRAPGTWLLVLWLLSALTAQTPAPQQPAPQAQSGAASSQAAGESHISPAEAQELFRSVDEILKFASQDTALPVHHAVKRELASREQVAAYVEQRMSEDEDAQRLQRSELVLKKFGLLPRNFDLRIFFLALLEEQVAGYYDPKTKMVNLLDWVAPAAQKPVLAHELTHALQDQAFDLERWMKQPRGASRKGGKSDATDISADEQIAARQAVAEGQGMVVLLDYMLAPTGQSVLTAPQIVEAMKYGMMEGENSPVFHSAPLYLKAALTFPYSYGLDFERRLLEKGGKEQAFAGVFRRPPQDTRQVMQPETYLAGEHIEAMPLPDFEQVLGKQYERFDTGAVGEFDVSVLLRQFGAQPPADELWRQWRGGYYYAARLRDKPSAPLALIYVARWARPQDADQFASVYAAALAQRYKNVRPAEAPASASVAQARSVVATVDIASPPARREWLTEEGPVLIEPRGDQVLVLESFDQPTSAKLRQAVFASPAAAAVRREGWSGKEPASTGPSKATENGRLGP